MNEDIILVIGSNGQLGSVLTRELQKVHGHDNVIASDLYVDSCFSGLFEILDATKITDIQRIVKQYSVTQIYHLAAILSAKGEEKPLSTWNLNIKMMLNVFEAARFSTVNKVFFPSSIAVFGDKALLEQTPQSACLNPATVYGISKAAGENWAQYYHTNYGLDIRSIRYPGIIGHQSMPGGGTTDYALDIYHSAVRLESYSCFLKAETKLPMIFMDDAVRATVELMKAPKENIKIRTAYNLGAMSFDPSEITAEIKQTYPDFIVDYCPDSRQLIADKWPKSIDDSEARSDWGWKPEYNLTTMTTEMIEKLKEKYNTIKLK
ncbi:MAG: NAD-dependent epimerase/dehydratase family protein [Flavobacteriaceae bacterium]|nr:NAD-dependent epimerase/dehydratase family protein [Flavobacteriaceae bacterium]